MESICAKYELSNDLKERISDYSLGSQSYWKSIYANQVLNLLYDINLFHVIVYDKKIYRKYKCNIEKIITYICKTYKCENVNDVQIFVNKKVIKINIILNKVFTPQLVIDKLMNIFDGMLNKNSYIFSGPTMIQILLGIIKDLNFTNVIVL